MPVRIKSEDNIDDVFQTMDIDDTDDEVVREMDVLLSPSLARNLFLMQYPLQHEAVTAPVAARIKPQHGMIEIEQPLPTDMERGDHGGKHNSTMTKRTFQSETIPIQTHMCLGKLEGSALHLVPLTHISQMRPSFGHVTTDPQQQIFTTSAEEDETGGDAAKMEIDTTTTTTTAEEKKPVVFQRKETERAALARKSSYAYKKASEESEKWQPLTVCGVNSKEHAQVMKQATTCQYPTRRVLASNGDDGDPSHSYAKSLNYLPSIKDPLDHMKSIGARLTSIMASGFPIPFSLLRARFDCEKISDEKLLGALAVYAVMVRGNFCLNSRFLPLPLALQQARTLILLLLEQDVKIKRTRLDQVYQGNSEVSSEQLLAFLKQVAKQTPEGWTLKVEDDKSFQARFPSQTSLHRDYWNRQTRRFESELQIYKAL